MEGRHSVGTRGAARSSELDCSAPEGHRLKGIDETRIRQGRDSFEHVETGEMLVVAAFGKARPAEYGGSTVTSFRRPLREKLGLEGQKKIGDTAKQLTIFLGKTLRLVPYSE